MKFSLITLATLFTLSLTAPTQYSPETDDVTALARRDPQSSGAIKAVGTVVKYAVTNSLKYVKTLTVDDKHKRQAFTQRVVNDIRRSYPGHSVVICNVRYDFNGAAIHRETVRYDANIGRDVTFDVIVWDRGTFNRRGDGGFENWAVIANRGCKINGGWVSC